MTEPDLNALLTDMTALREAIGAEAARSTQRWEGWIADPAYAASAANFAAYLALRRHDLRPLQRRLMHAGLSSLGRAESRVLPTLLAVETMLARATGRTPPDATAPGFHDGEALIDARAERLLGALSPHSPVRLLVTLPSEAARDPGFVRRLAELGVEAVRINCAHDDEDTWRAMIGHVEAAAVATGWRMKVLMDLAGPKIRTGAARTDKPLHRVAAGDRLAVTRPGGLDLVPPGMAAVECTLAEALAAARPDQRILVDDGLVVTRIIETRPWGIVAEVLSQPKEKGYKLKPEKGVNFPDTEFEIPALTRADMAALPFVARHADAIGFSFVQGPADIATLQQQLALLRDDWRELGLVLKVETARAVRALPDMMVRAAGQQPTAVMIARGDLAVEIGFARLAEMQEEILWLCEAAHVPAIWATQVVEGFVKTGVPSRGEMTDAAMAARAECVMLNKGPHVFEAIADLDRLWSRMRQDVSKKTPFLRPLKSW